MSRHGSRPLWTFAPAAAAALGLLAAPLLPVPALAQQAPATVSPDAQAPVNPPARVGRLAQVAGQVSFHTESEDQWQPAVLNYPVTAGNAFWTQPGSQAAIELDNARIAMNGGTEFDITALDESTLQAIQPQGEAYIHLRNLPQGQTMVITTPRGTVQLLSSGRYEIAAGDTQNPTLVSVLDGQAQVTGPGVDLALGGGQTATISGQDSFTGSISTLIPDPFFAAQLARERPPLPPAPAAGEGVPGGPFGAAPPPVVAQMTGGADLAVIGTWSSSPEYGAVWYPPVSPGWVPYREGHWAYVAPWGWTWIDAAPWGFAPFHYGRWVMVGPRWAWVPVVAAGPAYAPPLYARPVYAPALVSFFHIGINLGGVAVGITAGGIAAGAIGWVPLGPREIYYPPYRVTPAYVRQVNIFNAPQVTRIVNINRTVIVQRNVTINNFVNRRAVTVVPARVMVASQPIAPAVQHLPRAQLLGAARPVIGQAPLRPTVATLGVTPHVAQQLHIVPAGRPLPLRPVAPGPRIVARPVVPPRAPGVAHPPPPRPALRPVLPAPKLAPIYHPPVPVAPKSVPLVKPAPLPGVPKPAPYHPPVPVAPKPAPIYHPPAPVAPKPAPVYHPPAPAYHPPAPVYHPPAPAYHPPAPVYHPPAPAYHPPAPVYHPPVPAYHPPAPHPAPPPPKKLPPGAPNP